MQATEKCAHSTQDLGGGCQHTLLSSTHGSWESGTHLGNPAVGQLTLRKDMEAGPTAGSLVSVGLRELGTNGAQPQG